MSAGKTGRKKGQRSVEHESGQAEGRVNMMLWDSGGDENDDGCEKTGSPCLPGGPVTGCRFGGCDGNTSRETWTGGTRSPRTPWKEECLNSGLDSESFCLPPPSAVGWTSRSLARMWWRCCLVRCPVTGGTLHPSVAARTKIVWVLKSQRKVEMWSKGSQGRCRHNAHLGIK